MAVVYVAISDLGYTMDILSMDISMSFNLNCTHH